MSVCMYACMYVRINICVHMCIYIDTYCRILYKRIVLMAHETNRHPYRCRLSTSRDSLNAVVVAIGLPVQHAKGNRARLQLHHTHTTRPAPLPPPENPES